jgi:hypothetical protein
MFEDELQALVDKYQIEEISIVIKKTVTLKTTKKFQANDNTTTEQRNAKEEVRSDEQSEILNKYHRGFKV